MARSEVARMREQIEWEREAAWQGLHGVALGMARHDFINARVEHMAEHVFALKDAGREEEARGLMLDDAVWKMEQGYCVVCRAALPGSEGHEHAMVGESGSAEMVVCGDGEVGTLPGCENGGMDSGNGDGER